MRIDNNLNICCKSCGNKLSFFEIIYYQGIIAFYVQGARGDKPIMNNFFNDFFKGFIVGIAVTSTIYLAIELTR